MWLTEILERNCQQRGDVPAVIDGDRRLTWVELRDRSLRLAGVLAGRGVTRGAHVGVLSRNRLEVLESYFATAWLGAAFVPINHALTRDELVDVVDRVEIAHVLGERELLDRIGPARPGLTAFDEPGYELALRETGPPASLPTVSLDDPMAILLTSATTGRPKAVVQTHGAMMHMSLGWLAAVAAEEMTLLNLNPLSHGSVQVTLTYLAGGATVVVLRTFTPQGALREIERRRVTHVWLVPQMLRFMLQARAFDDTDLASLHEVLHGAAPMPPAVLKEAADRLPCPLRNVYGMTEMGGPFATVSTAEREIADDSWPGGRGIPGLLVRILGPDGGALDVGEIGEVCIQGPGMMRGYWADPESTAKTIRDGWLHTGDLGWMDRQGYVYLTDRSTDVLIRGGQNVYPAEIERCLLERPEVADAAVIGIPDEDWGETPVAYLVLADQGDTNPSMDADPSMLARINRELRARLASYKIPTETHVIAEIPRTGSGKVLKRVLRERRLAGAAQRNGAAESGTANG